MSPCTVMQAGRLFVLTINCVCFFAEMPLEITRSFIQNRDGTYELFKCPKVEVESIAETYGRLEKQPIIRPLELKTFLKVGRCLMGKIQLRNWSL